MNEPAPPLEDREAGVVRALDEFDRVADAIRWLHAGAAEGPARS